MLNQVLSSDSHNYLCSTYLYVKHFVIYIFQRFQKSLIMINSLTLVCVYWFLSLLCRAALAEDVFPSSELKVAKILR